jgi:hypothetical protein
MVLLAQWALTCSVLPMNMQMPVLVCLHVAAQQLIVLLLFSA